MPCPHCQSTATTERPDYTELGYCRFRYYDCKHVLNEPTGTLSNRPQYPTALVCLVIFWRFRYTLRPHDLNDGP
jgi:putative transposase